jgi:hypothetical protein
MADGMVIEPSAISHEPSKAMPSAISHAPFKAAKPTRQRVARRTFVTSSP